MLYQSLPYPYTFSPSQPRTPRKGSEEQKDNKINSHVQPPPVSETAETCALDRLAHFLQDDRTTEQRQQQRPTKDSRPRHLPSLHLGAGAIADGCDTAAAVAAHRPSQRRDMASSTRAGTRLAVGARRRMLGRDARIPRFDWHRVKIIVHADVLCVHLRFASLTRSACLSLVVFGAPARDCTYRHRGVRWSELSKGLKTLSFGASPQFAGKP